MCNIVLLKKICNKEKSLVFILYFWGFPGSSAGEESVCNARHPSLIPVSGRSPGEGIGYPVQYSWYKQSACNEADLGLIPGLGRSPGGGCGSSNSCLKTSRGQRSLAGFSSRGRKELDPTKHSTVLLF